MAITDDVAELRKKIDKLESRMTAVETRTEDYPEMHKAVITMAEKLDNFIDQSVEYRNERQRQEYQEHDDAKHRARQWPSWIGAAVAIVAIIFNDDIRGFFGG